MKMDPITLFYKSRGLYFDKTLLILLTIIINIFVIFRFFNNLNKYPIQMNKIY